MRAQGRPGEIPDKRLGRLIAVDGSVLTALPQLLGKLVNPKKGQWPWHCQVRVCDQTLIDSKLTGEASTKGHAERDVLAQTILTSDSDSETGQLFLMDRGDRSAALFNTIRKEGHDHVCRLNRDDGRGISKPIVNEHGEVIECPALSSVATDMGIVADELIAL